MVSKTHRFICKYFRPWWKLHAYKGVCGPFEKLQIDREEHLAERAFMYGVKIGRRMEKEK